MDGGDQLGCVGTYQLSELHLDVSGVPHHSNCTRPTPLKSIHQVEQSPVYMQVHGFMRLSPYPADMQDPWTHEVVSMPVHVQPLDTIGNETRQTRQHISSHQQSNVGVDGPRRDVQLCIVQSASGSSAPEAHIDDVSLNCSHADTCS